jgi:hypothetical protein
MVSPPCSLRLGNATCLLATAALLLGSSLAASSRSQCELKPGVKLGSDKVGGKNGTTTSTATACCTLCQANTKCIVFAWDKHKHICDIFHKMGDSKAKANYVSGLAHAVPPGPPVPPTPPSPPSPGSAFACDGKHCVAKAGGPYNNSKCDKKCKKAPKPPPPPPPPPPPAPLSWVPATWVTKHARSGLVWAAGSSFRGAAWRNDAATVSRSAQWANGYVGSVLGGPECESRSRLLLCVCAPICVWPCARFVNLTHLR